MNVIQRFRARQRDMKTLSKVITESLDRAQAEGVEHAGAHHLVLAALRMHDGTAAAVFERLGTGGNEFIRVVAAQEAEALHALGISSELADAAPPTEAPGTGRYGKSDATYEEAIKHVYDVHNERNDYGPLTGAHILAGVASVERGVAARAFRAMGLAAEDIIEAARADAASE